MTLLELVNKVLRGLREDAATSVSSGYPALIAQYVNEAKDDLEDLGPWYALRTTINKTLTDTATTSDLTAETNDRSYILREKNRPMVFLVTADSEACLAVVPYSEMLARRALNPDQPDGVPCAVAFNRDSTGLTAHFWPGSSGSHDVRFIMVVPQDDLEAETDELSVPAGPVWRDALVRAMEERGEEFAGPLDAQRHRAAVALNNALGADWGGDELTVEAV